MAETTTARKPSLRPRTTTDTQPVKAEQRPTLQLVPAVPDIETETGNLNSETETAPPPDDLFPQVSASDGANGGTVRDRVSGFWASTTAVAGRTQAYWTPPAIFTDRPASVADLADYARHAPWTAQNAGLIRKAGNVYWSGLALPYTAISRYREWMVQRPGRLAAHLGVLKLFTLTTPGMWVVDHLVYPVAQFAGHVFL